LIEGDAFTLPPALLANCAGVYDLLAPVARVTGWVVHTPLYRLEMKQLPSTARIVEAAKRTLAAS
jgi:pyruvate dehydrogenase E1 component beta subunit